MKRTSSNLLRKFCEWTREAIKRHFGHTRKEQVIFAICLGLMGWWVMGVYFLVGFSILDVDYLPQTTGFIEFLDILPGAISNQWKALTAGWSWPEKFVLCAGLIYTTWLLAKLWKIFFLKIM